jgi:hypothetical protein
MKFNKLHFRIKKKNKYGAEWINSNILKKAEYLEHKINEYITLKLMEEGRTYIYVNGSRFVQCIRLILNITKSDVHIYKEVDSIDEAANLYNTHLHQNRIVRGPAAVPVPDQRHDITPEQEFWGHCSNIQAWVEHDYDTRILMTNISFPLLRELTKAGDPLAKNIFKEEIALRLESGYPSVVEYLLNQGYIKHFTPSEFKTILESTNLTKGLSSDIKTLSCFIMSCVSKFPTLLEDILLRILRIPEGKDILISVISTKLNSYLRPLYRFNPLFLLSLKAAFEDLFSRVDESMGEDIVDCMHAIKKNLDEEDISLTYLSERNYLEFIRNLFLNNIHSANLNDAGYEEKVQFYYKIYNDLRKTQSRCSYCGKTLPEGKDTCDWCGHKKGSCQN